VPNMWKNLDAIRKNYINWYQPYLDDYLVAANLIASDPPYAQLDLQHAHFPLHRNRYLLAAHPLLLAMRLSSPYM
jgi:hypothetical protein